MTAEELLDALNAVIACGCVGFQPIQYAAGIFKAGVCRRGKPSCRRRR